MLNAVKRIRSINLPVKTPKPKLVICLETSIATAMQLAIRYRLINDEIKNKIFFIE